MDSSKRMDAETGCICKLVLCALYSEGVTSRGRYGGELVGRSGRRCVQARCSVLHGAHSGPQLDQHDRLAIEQLTQRVISRLLPYIRHEHEH